MNTETRELLVFSGSKKKEEMAPTRKPQAPAKTANNDCQQKKVRIQSGTRVAAKNQSKYGFVVGTVTEAVGKGKFRVKWDDNNEARNAEFFSSRGGLKKIFEEEGGGATVITLMNLISLLSFSNRMTSKMTQHLALTRQMSATRVMAPMPMRRSAVKKSTKRERGVRRMRRTKMRKK